MNKLFLLLGVLIITHLHLTAQNSRDHSLLWRIEGNGLKQPSYLYGTMHVKDERAFHFNDSVFTSMERCENFAMEIHPDTMVNVLFNNLFNSDSNNNVRALFSKQEYEKLDNQFQEETGLSLDFINLKYPKFLKSLITRKSNQRGKEITFLDAYLLGVAKSLNKNIHGLERIEDQMELLSEKDKVLQKKELEELFGSGENDSYETYLELLKLYYQGDLDGIGSLSVKTGMIDSVMINRNHNMIRRMETLMRQGPTFTAVGVAHLPGHEGLIDLLVRDGYRVSAVKATFSGVSARYKYDPASGSWFNYRDDTVGFSLSMPGKPIKTRFFYGLNALLYPDITSGGLYGLYIINQQGESGALNNSDFPENNMIDRIVKNYEASEGANVIKKRRFNREGVGITEIYLETQKKVRLRLQLMQNKQVLYCFFTGNSKEQVKSKSADRFFNSIQFFHPTYQSTSGWIEFKEPKAAFSVRLPLMPERIKKEIANPIEPEGPPYVINMFMSSDMGTMTNYLLRYNDYPAGVFMADRSGAFQSLIEEFKSKGEFVSEPERISLDGNEGIAIKMMLAEKYYCELRFYFRGNRMYLVMKQNLFENNTKLHEDEFFSSFKFTPFEPSTSITYKPENELFELKVPDSARIVNDSNYQHTSYLRNTTSCISNNPNSGGVYILEYSLFNDYFKLDNLSKFYDEFIQKVLEPSDSIIRKDSVEADGYFAKGFIAYKKESKNLLRGRICIINSYLFYQAAYIGKEELDNFSTKEFFDSLRFQKGLSNLDLYSSKRDLIIAGLHSSDTLIYHKALGSLSYYKFEEGDLPVIYSTLKESFPDDTSAEGCRCQLINSLSNMEKPNCVDMLGNLFHDTDNDFIRATILNNLPRIDSIKGWNLYLKLITQDIPIHDETMAWLATAPLNKSTKTILEHINEISELLTIPIYRNPLLNMIVSRLNQDTVFREKLRIDADRIMKPANEDLEKYRFQFIGNEEPYSYSLMFYYLELMKTYPVSENPSGRFWYDSFTRELLKTDTSLAIEALITRIKNSLPVEKELLIKQLDDNKANRFRIVFTLYEMKQSDLLPQKYKSPEKLSEFCLYDYLCDDEACPEVIQCLGSVYVEKNYYYIFSFTYKGEEVNGNKKEESSFLAITGPFGSKNVIQDFGSIRSWSKWEILEKDWKSQAESDIRKLIDQGEM